MRLVACVLVSGFFAQATAAQTTSSTPVAYDEPNIARPGSPSIANSSVSPATVPHAMDRMIDAEGFDLSLGASYAEGKFGSADRATIHAVALSVRYATGPVRLSASLPWMRIRGRSLVFTGIDATPIIVARDVFPVRTTSRGVGDLTLGADYLLTAQDSPTEVELSGRVKVPTASEGSGLSTQKVDVALGGQVTHEIGALAPFVSATYRVFGDPAGYDLRDGFAGSAGTSVLVGERTFLVASYHYARAASRLVRDSHELFGGGSTALGRSGLRATGFVTAGLSGGAADLSAGAALSLGF